MNKDQEKFLNWMTNTVCNVHTGNRTIMDKAFNKVGRSELQTLEEMLPIDYSVNSSTINFKSIHRNYKPEKAIFDTTIRHTRCYVKTLLSVFTRVLNNPIAIRQHDRTNN